MVDLTAEKKSSRKMIDDFNEPDKNDYDILHLLCKWRAPLMGFAALLILFFHTGKLIVDSSTFIGKIELFIKRSSFVGVDIFLLLSGIGLTFSIAKNNIKIFYLKRIKRILVPTLIIAVINAIWGHWSIIEFFKKIFLYDFFMVSVYSFLWFIPLITIFYLFFPLYYKFFSKAKDKIFFTLSAILILLIIVVPLKDHIRIDFFALINRIPIFLIGILFGWLEQNKKIIFPKVTMIFILIIFFIGLQLSYLTNFKNVFLILPLSNCFLPNILISISLPFLFAKILDYTRNLYIGKHIIKALSFLGAISFELYCVQELLLEFFKFSVPNIIFNILVLIIFPIFAFLVFSINKLVWRDKIHIC